MFNSFLHCKDITKWFKMVSYMYIYRSKHFNKLQRNNKLSVLIGLSSFWIGDT